MNNRSIISTSDSDSREIVLDGYLPANKDDTSDTPGFEIDATWLRGALYRQRWLIGATVLAAVLLGLIVTLLATPIYEARSSVRVQPWGNYIVPGQNVATTIGSSNEIEYYMQTQKSVVESRRLAVAAAENLNPASRNAILENAGRLEGLPDGNATEREQAVIERTAGVLHENVIAEVPVDRQVISIAYRSEDRVLAAEVANAYSQAFMQSDTLRNVESNQYAQQYLREQIESVREQLEDSERASNTYARSTGIVTSETTGVDGESAQTIIGANLASINQTVAAARANRISAEQRWRAASGTPAQQLPEVQESPVYQNLAATRATLEAELSDLRRRYNNDFPAVVDVRAKIADLDRQIEQAAQDVKAGIRNEYLVAQRQEAALERELGNATENALVEQDQTIEYAGLEREADALRQQLTSLLDRFNSISTAANVQTGAITLLDEATVPGEPVSPSLSRNMLVATMLGLLFAGGLALVREIFVDQFRRAEDVEDRLGLPVLGLTPYVDAKEIDPQDVNQFSALMEAYASIRSTIDVAVPRDSAVVQLTSSGPSEGKSTTALILSELFARLGRQTLLIDADFRKPSIVKLLDLKQGEAGLTEVILGHAAFEDAVIEGAHDNLHVLSTTTAPPNPVELLSSQRFREFIEEQRQNYSLIMIDTSPVLGLADAPEIAQVVDSTIFVIEANRTSFNQATTSLRRLRNVGANVIGAVLTKYRALEAGVDYNYQYQYYQYGDNVKK